MAAMAAAKTLVLVPLLSTSSKPKSHIGDYRKSLVVGAAGLLGSACLALSLVGPASAAPQLPLILLAESLPLQLAEPSNALSLPTWAIHVSSVVEWITAMTLVWIYGDKSGFESWKGLSWGMVPLLGGAFCACTWHFFYNSESLDSLPPLLNLSYASIGLLLPVVSVLVAYQAALTVIGNATMCYAAFRIYKSSKEGSQNS
ncbi:hypothetical protein ACFE04_013440 [Oxalis oulophora]